MCETEGINFPSLLALANALCGFLEASTAWI